MGINLEQFPRVLDSLQPQTRPLANSHPRPFRWKGLALAAIIILLWMFSLGMFMRIPLTSFSWVETLLAIAIRTFLHTGLFIIAHDAMHGSLWPHNRRLNHQLGTIASELYAFLPYEPCRRNHHRHHRHPAQKKDPDFHDGIHRHPLRWYGTFMVHYLASAGLARFLLKWILLIGVMHQMFHVAIGGFLLFWILPLWLSSIQLFVFGTYFPHRQRDPENAHHAHSSNYPVWLSFLTCYHFGYHWEHHEYPSVPWYQLPRTRGFVP